MSDESREQFEAEFRRVHAGQKNLDMYLEMYNHGTEEDPEIDYYSLAARDAWKWWQKSRAALVVELPEQFYPDGDIDCPKVMNTYEVVESLAIAGITAKGEGDG